jgi:hypothetical protein
VKHAIRLSLSVLALVASAVSASPAFAAHGEPHRPLIALHGEGHWENSVGPRGTARWVFTPVGDSQPSTPIAMHKPVFATHKAG